MDEVIRLIALQVSDSLQFHLDECNTHLDMWTKLQGLFGTMNEFKEFQIKEDLTSLILDSFLTIDDFLMKLNQTEILIVELWKDKD